MLEETISDVIYEAIGGMFLIIFVYVSIYTLQAFASLSGGIVQNISNECITTFYAILAIGGSIGIVKLLKLAMDGLLV